MNFMGLFFAFEHACSCAVTKKYVGG